MPAPSSDNPLRRLLDACHNAPGPGPLRLDDARSRLLAAAYARPGTALAHWGNGIPIAYTTTLFDDTADMLLAGPPVALTRADRDRDRALEALLDHFTRRAAAPPPTRGEYANELTHRYAAEFAFLRACGHTPYIDWDGAELSIPNLCAALDDNHRLHAVNGLGDLVGSRTQQQPGPWAVGIYDHAGSPVTAHGHATTFPGAYTAALQSFARGDPPD